jgi:hypothetical protein
LGTVYRNGRAGSIIEVARIDGKIFKTMKEAEAHGLELAREWIDSQAAVEGRNLLICLFRSATILARCPLPISLIKGFLRELADFSTGSISAG